MTRADYRTVNRLDKWLEGELTEVAGTIRTRKRRGMETMINEERARTLEQARTVLQNIHREETRR